MVCVWKLETLDLSIRLENEKAYTSKKFITNLRNIRQAL